jgi:hypothetical protein
LTGAVQVVVGEIVIEIVGVNCDGHVYVYVYVD